MSAAVKFLHHAEQRIAQRGLDRQKITEICNKIAPMLKPGSALRVRVDEQVVVAQKRAGKIEVITAWRKPKN